MKCVGLFVEIGEVYCGRIRYDTEDELMRCEDRADVLFANSY